MARGQIVGEGQMPTLNFSAVEKLSKYFFCQKMFIQNANFGAEKTFMLIKFRGKIKMLSTHNVFC